MQFFLLIPNKVSNNSRMHLDPLYDQKTGLGQSTQFCSDVNITKLYYTKSMRHLYSTRSFMRYEFYC